MRARCPLQIHGSIDRRGLLKKAEDETKILFQQRDNLRGAVENLRDRKNALTREVEKLEEEKRKIIPFINLDKALLQFVLTQALTDLKFQRPDLFTLSGPERSIDFLIEYCRGLRKKDFITKMESVTRKRKGKREYLKDAQTRLMMKELRGFFESKVDVPRIRVGKSQTVETLINEEALLLGKFLRDERKTWVPRLAL